MKKFASIFICLFLLCSTAMPAMADDLDKEYSPERIAGLVQKYYAKGKTMHAEFNQVLRHQASGSEQKRKGEMIFQKPLKVRWWSNDVREDGSAGDDEELFVIADGIIWQYVAAEEVVYKYKSEDLSEQNPFVKVLTSQERLDKSFKLTPLGVEFGLVKLTLTPKNPTQSMTNGTIWVDPKDGRIARLFIVDAFANDNDITMDSQKIGGKVAPDTFKFTPPAGVEIEDNTR